jgi:UDP-galactopyranose mutase
MRRENIGNTKTVRLNIEVKSKCVNHRKIEEKILGCDRAIFKGTDHQIDLYFNVNFGRLKLREGDISTGEPQPHCQRAKRADCASRLAGTKG